MTTTFSKCAWCHGTIGRGDPNSHGICPDCLLKNCPNCQASKRHAEAMRRGLERMRAAGLHTIADMVEKGEYNGTHSKEA